MLRMPWSYPPLKIFHSIFAVLVVYHTQFSCLWTHFLYNQDNLQEPLPENHKVSIAWQIVFTFLPVVSFWAFYRIRKLRRYVLYIIVPQAAITAFIFSYMLQISAPLFRPDGSPISNESQMGLIVLSYLASAVLQGLTIYLVIIWSRAHNRQFDQPTTQTQPPA